MLACVQLSLEDRHSLPMACSQDCLRVYSHNLQLGQVRKPISVCQLQAGINTGMQTSSAFTRIYNKKTPQYLSSRAENPLAKNPLLVMCTYPGFKIMCKQFTLATDTRAWN